jgi:hypothetical protein
VLSHLAGFVVDPAIVPLHEGNAVRYSEPQGIELVGGVPDSEMFKDDVG